MSLPNTTLDVHGDEGHAMVGGRSSAARTGVAGYLRSQFPSIETDDILQLETGDKATAELRITGLFWADDPEGFVRLLESGFKISAERSGDVIRLGQRL